MKKAGRIAAGADWLVDVALPNVLVTALTAAWLGAAVLLFLVAPWYAGVVALLVGVPFAVAVANAATDG